MCKFHLFSYLKSYTIFNITILMVNSLSSSCINTVVVLGFKVNLLSSDIRMILKCSTCSDTLSLLMSTDIHADKKGGWIDIFSSLEE